MICLIARPRLSIMARLRFCSAIIQSSRVLFLALVMVISVADIALGDDLVAFDADTDIQSV